MQRQFFKDEIEHEEPEQKPKTFSRGEKTGIIIAVGALLYGLSANDLPVVFFTVSFLAFMGKALADAMGGKKGKVLAGFLQGLGIALFLGSLFLLFV